MLPTQSFKKNLKEEKKMGGERKGEKLRKSRKQNKKLKKDKNNNKKKKMPIPSFLDGCLRCVENTEVGREGGTLTTPRGDENFLSFESLKPKLF